MKASLLADPELFAIFEKGDIDEQIGEIIYRSLRFKKSIVEQDLSLIHILMDSMS